jgi:hypothetical protein
MKRTLRYVLLLVLSLAALAHAQQFNMGFGVSALGSPTSNLESFGKQGMGGGAYLSFSGDFIFWKQVGVQGEVAWRASENLYQGFQPYRTIFYDFNGIYAPSLGRHASLELLGGIGAASHRFYTPFVTCSFTSCTNYVSSNHFMWHTGAGIKIYLTDRVFIRPEAHGYFIHNNVEFSDNIAYRFGASLGYTFGERETHEKRRRY